MKKNKELALYEITTKFDTFYIVAFNALDATNVLINKFGADKLEELKGINKLTEMSYQVMVADDCISQDDLVYNKED